MARQKKTMGKKVEQPQQRKGKKKLATKKKRPDALVQTKLVTSSNSVRLVGTLGDFRRVLAKIYDILVLVWLYKGS
jgi:hypothetical protein